MKKALLLAVVILGVFGLLASPGMALGDDCPCKGKHEGRECPNKKGPSDGESRKVKKEGDREGRKCGQTSGQFLEQLRKDHKGNTEEAGRHVKDHFKLHKDGVCHCACNHDKGGDKPEGKPDRKPDGEGKREGDHEGRKCGRNPGQFLEQLRKDHKGDAEESGHHVKEHFKRHKDGVCHCACNHDKPEGERKPKGNNGVGNGEDPQPPGHPKLNDGPGTGRGEPGNKGSKK